MELVRPTWRRAAGMVLLALAMATAFASPAHAHNGTGGDSSDYRITIVGFEGDPSGVLLRVVELGDRLELRRESAAVVVVVGYEGEPYLRLDAEGVWENTSSPAHYLNADRFAAEQPPRHVTAESEPSWTRVSGGTSVRWHDHRAHWMSPTPPVDVSADPEVARVVSNGLIELSIDGRAVSAQVEVNWLPPPQRLRWLLAASVIGAIVTAALVLQPLVRRLLPILAVAAATGSMLGQGVATAQLALGGVIVATAAVAALLRTPTLSVMSALAAAVLAALRLEVFEHELLAGWLPGLGQRVAIVGALGLGFGIAAAGLVTALSPTPTAEPERSDAA